MEQFTNTPIDTTTLPRFETVPFTALHPDYKKVIILHIAVFILVLVAIAGILLVVNPELASRELLLGTGIGIAVFGAIVTFFSLLSFRKKGFAFRQHDVLFRSGVIATKTIIIPYSRVQHVALHQGFVSGKLGLAAIEIFTAGGGDSDIHIPGIEKEHAENIKQLLMTKLNHTTKETTAITPSEDEL